jgi:sortase A
VVRYWGSPDDAEGTRIQDLGPTASPSGPGGGAGPGQVGNFIVTGHRTSHTAPFRDLPALRTGARVVVRYEGTTLHYRVTATRWTSFRSQRSLAEQSAAVPGRPGDAPVRPMITLSTCATPEDRAAGNHWSDRFGNPEHRIDKIGVLVAELPARRLVPVTEVEPAGSQ